MADARSEDLSATSDEGELNPSDGESKTTRNVREPKLTRNGGIIKTICNGEESKTTRNGGKSYNLTPDSKGLERYAKTTMSSIKDGILSSIKEEKTDRLTAIQRIGKRSKIHRPKAIRLKPGRKPTYSK